MQWIAETALAGQHVGLEPLHTEHISGLQAAVMDGELWKLWYAAVPSPEEMASYVAVAMEGAAKGNVAYAVRDLASGRLVGSTRFYDVAPEHRRALLGYTWYAGSARGTHVNAECKYLLLRHFFEAAGGNAIEFRTHFFNAPSRGAIEKLGAKLDGILRSHQIMKDGSIRDTVVYSILAGEWPAVRNRLLSRLGRLPASE